MRERFRKYRIKLECISKILRSNFFEVATLNATGVEVTGYAPDKMNRYFNDAAEDLVIDIRREIEKEG